MPTIQDLFVEASTITNEIAMTGGEITPALEARLSALEANVARKADSCDFIIKRLEHEEEYFDRMAKAYDKIAKSYRRARESLRERFKFAMQKMGVDEVLGDDVKLSLVNGAPKLVIDESLLPAKFWITETINRPDKDLIRERLKAGELVPGAHLEPTVQLRSYVNKK